ncbi:hypothetical protein MD484_g8948, partial [Candolleomyces efflorescens]
MSAVPGIVYGVAMTLLCSGCDRQLFDPEEKFRKVKCCNGLICEGCTALLLPLAPETSITRNCPICRESKSFDEDSLQVIYFTHQMNDSAASMERDAARLADLKANRIYQACIEEVQQLEAKQKTLQDRYRSLVNKFNMNRTVAFETSTRLTETSDAIKAYQATTEALQAELEMTRERNDELRQQVLASQAEGV